MSEREAIVAIEELVDVLYASGTQIEQEASEEQACQAEHEILKFTAKQLAETIKECVVIVKAVPSPDLSFDLNRAVATLEKLKGACITTIVLFTRTECGKLNSRIFALCPYNL